MLTKERVQYIIIGCGLLAGLWLAWSAFSPGDDHQRQKSIAELKNELASGESAMVRADAAVRLGGKGDITLVPELLKAMEDPDPLVRGRAAASVAELIGGNFYFDPNGPEDIRQEALQRIKTHWESYKKIVLDAKQSPE